MRLDLRLCCIYIMQVSICAQLISTVGGWIKSTSTVYFMHSDDMRGCVRTLSSVCLCVFFIFIFFFQVVVVKCSPCVCLRVKMWVVHLSASSHIFPENIKRSHYFDTSLAFFPLFFSSRMPWVKISFHSLCDLTDWSRLKVKKIAVFVAGLSQTHTSHSCSLS